MAKYFSRTGPQLNFYKWGKNFKLIQSTSQDKRTILQFGKTFDPTCFIMDFGYPLTLLQAFSICLAVLHK